METKLLPKVFNRLLITKEVREELGIVTDIEPYMPTIVVDDTDIVVDNTDLVVD